MSLNLNEDQQEFRRSIRRFLEAKSDESAVRAAMETDTGHDPEVWRQMAVQLGLQGIAIPEELGGAGFGFVELAIVQEELGRTLTSGPYFSSAVLAANLLLLSGDDAAQRRYLPAIADGSLIATVAVAETAGRWEEEAISLPATEAGTGHHLSGEKLWVTDGVLADLVLVVARTSRGCSVFAVEAGAVGLTRHDMATMDLTRKQARLVFDDVPATLIGIDGAGWPAVESMLDRAAIAMAAEQSGGAEKVLEMAVEYAKVREQFGRLIGSYQAIKHKCADMLIDAESARSVAYYGARAIDEGSEEVPVVASLAKAFCSEAYLRSATENIHIHGGIGFTWEHPAHLYFKRAKTSLAMFGSAARHRELMLDRLGI